jgi:hypothetical protein
MSRIIIRVKPLVAPKNSRGLAQALCNQSFKHCRCCGLTSVLCRSRCLKNQRRYISAESHDEDISETNPHIRKLLENNRLWVKETNEKDPAFFPKLGQGQAPKYLYFGCSDSRVSANQILGLG